MPSAYLQVRGFYTVMHSTCELRVFLFCGLDYSIYVRIPFSFFRIFREALGAVGKHIGHCIACQGSFSRTVQANELYSGGIFFTKHSFSNKVRSLRGRAYPVSTHAISSSTENNSTLSLHEQYAHWQPGGKHFFHIIAH